MKAKDVMHKGAILVELNASLKDIAMQMRDADVGAVLVKDHDRLVGVVTDRDLACRAFAKTDDVNKLTAENVMTADVICCSPDDDVRSVVEIMESKKIRRIPVADQHKVVGMLSLGDISHKVGKELSGEVLRAVSAHHSR